MKQITVLAPNRTGILADITAALAERGVNIEDIDVEGMTDDGIVVLTVDQYDLALRTLRDHGYKAISQEALIVRLEDRPGALAEVAVRLRNAGLDVRSMHIAHRDAGRTLASLVVSDPTRAAEVLSDVIVVEPPK